MTDERFKPEEVVGEIELGSAREAAIANAAYALALSEVDGAAESLPGCTAFWKNIVYETGEQDGMVVEHEDDSRTYTYGPSLTNIILAAAKANPTERKNNAD